MRTPRFLTSLVFHTLTVMDLVLIVKLHYKVQLALRNGDCVDIGDLNTQALLAWLLRLETGKSVVGKTSFNTS